MRNLLSEPWWKLILMGVSTAIPAEWIDPEDRSLRLAGESAEEFMEILEEHKIQPSPELAKACAEYIARRAIAETGRHPNGVTREEWENTYDGQSRPSNGKA